MPDFLLEKFFRGGGGGGKITTGFKQKAIVSIVFLLFFKFQGTAML